MSIDLTAEFLRTALAAGPLRVPELEAKARVAGLLGECQRATHAKLFKRAKKSLGIRSVRSGFARFWRAGAGNWTEHSQRPARRAVTAKSPVSETIDRRISLDWIDGVAALDDGGFFHPAASPAIMAAFLGGLPRFLDLTSKLGGTRRVPWLECARPIRLPPQSPSRSPWQRWPALDYRRRRACRAALRLRCHRGCEGPITAQLTAVAD